MADITNGIMTNDKTKILSGNPLNFYTPRSQRIRSFKVYFSPKQEGSGTPSPENVRPISGWTGVEISHCGKNLIDEDFLRNGDNYHVAGAYGYQYTNWIYLAPNTQYKFTWSNFDNDKISDKNCNLYVANAAQYIINNGKYRQYSAFTTNSEGTIRFGIYRTGTSPYADKQELLDAIFDNGHLQLELGSTSTDYTPYKTNLLLPKEYQQVEYLESTGTQFIDTGITIVKGDTTKTFVVMDFSAVEFLNRIDVFFSDDDNSYGGAWVGFDIGKLRAGNKNLLLTQPKDRNTITIIADGINHEINTNKEQNTWSRGNAARSGTITVFANKTLTFASAIRLYSLKILSDIEEPLRNLIPCYRISDNKPGMYDTVTNTFYTNSGTGEFITGPAVNRYDIDWSEDVGTVYGGYVDLVSGELVETYGKIELTGEENLAINPWNGNGVYWQVRETSYDTAKIPFMNGKSYGNILPYYNNGYYPKTDGCFTLMGAGTIPNYTYLMLYNSNWGTTVEEYKSALKELYDNETPLTIVAPLKTVYHQTHQLPPATLSTLMFDNNFWSNADRIEIEYDYIGVFDALESRKSIMSGTPHLETAKDSIISFGTDMAANLKECKVYFKPKQDLHGYSKPWIGGTGKNLFDKESVEKWYYIAQDGSIVEHTADIPCWTISNYIPVTSNSKITYIGLTNVGTSPYSAWYDENKNLISTFKQEIGTNTLTVPSTASFIRFSVRGATPNDLDGFMVANVESISEYEPYENICPIEGWDGITITNGSEILTISEWEIGAINADSNNVRYDYNRYKTNNSTRVRCKYLCNLDINKTYRVIWNTNDYELVTQPYDPNGYAYRPSSPHNIWQTTVYEFSNVANIAIAIRRKDLGNITINDAELADVKIVTYSSLTIPFPQTIYGGYVDLVKGEIVEEYAGVVGWTQYKQNNGFIAYRTDISNYKNNNCMCNMIGEYGSFNTSNMTKNIIQDAKVGVYKYLALDETININDLIVVLPLATSNTYSLTSQTITTLRGANTIWTNSNDETEVKYYTHSEDAYQHIPTSDAITSNDDFLLVTDDGYVIGTEDDFITY